MSVTSVSFDYIRELVQRHSGIILERGKEYLVESRLTPLAHKEGYETIENMVTRLSGKPFGSLHQKVVEGMTTNETSFFRDKHPFDTLKNVLIPELQHKRVSDRQLHIWCGASSTGQEPYSLAMLLREHFPGMKGWFVRIVATDISDTVLEKARKGIFTQIEVNRGLPIAFLMKYFEKHGTEWKIKEEIRKMIEFHKMNLAEKWSFSQSFDIVMMRNVMIYFDVAMKKNILKKIREVLKPDGYLFLGGSETTLNLDDSYQRIEVVQSGAYQLKV